MKGLLALAVIAAFASGLIGTWAFSQVTGQAGAAPPPPSPTQVREQNLDGSGFIRVHEQGTANVNVANLPTVQDVNVVSLPGSPQARLIELGTQSVPPASAFTSAFQNVSDCDKASISAMSPTGFRNLNLEIHSSPDGVHAIFLEEIAAERTVDGMTTISKHDLPVVSPFLRVRVVYDQAGATIDITAWIWCEP